MKTTTKRFAALAGIALTGSLALTACSSGTANYSTPSSSANASSSSTSAASSSASGQASQNTAHNTQDVMFTQMMLPHHEQAVEMSDILLAKTGLSQEMTTLLNNIKKAQGPEIEKMKGWLKSWGQPEMMSGSGHMNHGMGMDGMMSDADLQKLRDANASDASKLFLEQMIQHHEGAIDMARTEVSGGQNPEVVSMAKSVVSDQQAEIDHMKQMLSGMKQ